MSNDKARKLINPELTKMILRFHEEGFTEDFYLNHAQKKLCWANFDYQTFSHFRVAGSFKFNDARSGQYLYLHKIHTDCGTRGLLIFQFPLIR